MNDTSTIDRAVSAAGRLQPSPRGRRDPRRPPPAPDRGRHLSRLNAVPVHAAFGGYHAEFVSWGYYDPLPWRNYLHTHSFYEICYAYAGQGVFRTGDEVHDVVPGMVFVARPGDVHEIVADDDDPLGIYFWGYTLVPVRRGEGDQPARRDARHDHGGARQRDRGWRHDDTDALLDAFVEQDYPVFSTRAGRLPDLVDLLAREAAEPGLGGAHVISALASTLVVDTARAMVDAPSSGDFAESLAAGADLKAADSTAAIMVRYLKDNYDRSVSVRDVAAQVHLSDRHASRLFRRFTGLSVHAYLTNYRLEVAAQRLVEHGWSVKEVARSCGYPDVRHFTTAFRRHWGAPPATFRRRAGTHHLDSGPVRPAR